MPSDALLYRLDLPALRRYLAWLSAWIVEGERLRGEFRSPYQAKKEAPGVSSGPGALGG